MNTTREDLDGLGGIGGKREPPLANVAFDEPFEAWLIDGDRTALEGGNLCFVVVGTDHLYAEFRETGAAYQSDVAGSDHANIHRSNSVRERSTSGSPRSFGQGPRRDRRPGS